MSKKQLLLIIVLGLILGGAGLYIMKTQDSSFKRASQKMGSKLLGKDYDINSVATVHIQNSSNAVDLVKTGDTWTVKERNGYPANFGKLAEELRKLVDIKIAKAVNAAPARLPALGLVPPTKNGDATLVEFKDNSGKATKTLLLGKEVMRESSQPSPYGGDSSYPVGRYVMVDGSPNDIALVSDPLTQLAPRAQDWISKDWFKVEKPNYISVTSTNATNSWTLERPTEAGDWKLADAKPGEELDKTKISSVTSALSYASFNDVATNDEATVTGMDHPIEATMRTFEGFTYKLKIGNETADDNNYYFKVAVSADIPKERTPGKDEKKEDKEKLDKEFKEKTDKLETKLKNEQACEKWTYLVSKYTVEPFLKTRADLLAEKKEEKKEEPKSASTLPVTPKKQIAQPVPPPPLPGKTEAPPAPKKEEGKAAVAMPAPAKTETNAAPVKPETAKPAATAPTTEKPAVTPAASQDGSSKGSHSASRAPEDGAEDGLRRGRCKD